ncbi:hypothetical protein PCANC_00166 [Puccinia coronata f. sp. avenae]|uniref:Uncharacterized protein n=1 Tax=Puccinia coronata f. sp. avenae TaxID=200324 RepID=A0A2N5W8G6_9BASI|nr:hypothetical protein PCANC_00166 [Puccinia coronata f. sp. avenae]
MEPKIDFFAEASRSIPNMNLPEAERVPDGTNSMPFQSSSSSCMPPAPDVNNQMGENPRSLVVSNTGLFTKLQVLINLIQEDAIGLVESASMHTSRLS